MSGDEQFPGLNFIYRPKVQTDHGEVLKNPLPVLPIFASFYMIGHGIASGEINIVGEGKEKERNREKAMIGLTHLLELIDFMRKGDVAWFGPWLKTLKDGTHRVDFYKRRGDQLAQAAFSPEKKRLTLRWHERNPFLEFPPTFTDLSLISGAEFILHWPEKDLGILATRVYIKESIWIKDKDSEGLVVDSSKADNRLIDSKSSDVRVKIAEGPYSYAECVQKEVLKTLQLGDLLRNYWKNF